jgi:hypothetical protein
MEETTTEGTPEEDDAIVIPADEEGRETPK